MVKWVAFGLSNNNNKWWWWVWLLTPYRQPTDSQCSLVGLGWGAVAIWHCSVLIIWTGWTLEVACHDDSTINMIIFIIIIFKPPPPVGAGGGYMFSGRPSMRASVRPSVRASVIHVVVLCFRDISSICWQIFAKLLSLVRLGTEMNWLDFGVKRSKFKVTAWPNASQIFVPLYLQYLLIDFRQTFVTGASWDTDDLITFLGQKVKAQGHDATIECNFF